MSKFDTNGGYFAPKDYLRVNEGGSHEENPNGGVQIGVDPEGNPNLLEEGEPVYKDYVYSDNITAEREFLEQNNLPGKYEGKLYSKIADDFVTEAEERPLDPISRNGLEAMLGRLAEAQEGQKQRDQQRELEDELANLSPEELDQLEMMLAQGEQGQMVPEQMPIEAVPEEQMPVEGMPMMCNGGFIRKFDIGGNLGEPDKTPEQIMLEAQQARLAQQQLIAEQEAAEKAESRRSAQEGMIRRYERQLKRNEKAYDRLVKNAGKVYPADAASYKTLLKKQQGLVDYSKKRLEDAKASYDAAYPSVPQITVSPADTLLDNAPLVERRDTVPPVIIDNRTGQPMDTTGLYLRRDVADDSGTRPDYDSLARKVATRPGRGLGNIVGYGDDAFHRRGGKINRFDGGGWGEFLDTLWNYKESLNPSAAAGKYAIDRAGKFWNGMTGRQVEAAPNYDAFTQYVLSHGDDPYVQRYLRALDVGVNKDQGVPLLWDADNQKLVDNWQDLYKHRRTDGDLGIYHITPEDIGFLTAPAVPVETVPEPQLSELPVYPQLRGISQGPMFDWVKNNPTGTRYQPRDIFANASLYPEGTSAPTGIDATAKPKPENNVGAGEGSAQGYNILPTWPRYTGAIGSGLLGLYNAFQQPDKYTQRRLNPQLPEGRIYLQNQVYNPLDQNMVANAIAAQGNATNRVLRNTGLGPSVAASILAADNNYTGNLGQGFIQTWDANNQRRNQVIAANNQSEAQRANFDWTVDAARKNILNDAAYKNNYNDLMLQRLNYASEADKYNAISNQISNGLQALSGIGKENFTMNQINTNPAFLGYGYGANGAIFYNPITKRWEMKSPKSEDKENK